MINIVRNIHCNSNPKYSVRNEDADNIQ